MGPNITRQDVQNIIQVALNRSMERVASRQDVILLSDTIRNLTALHQQSQQLLKQSEYQRLQLTRRAAAVEARLASLENELKSTQILVARVLDRMAAQSLQQQQIKLPAQAEQQPAATPATQYVYRPQ